MVQGNPTASVPNKSTRFSYVFVTALLVVVGFLHLATPLLAALFSYLALSQLYFLKHRKKWVAVALFLILISAISYAAGHFINNSVRELPEIAEKSIPKVIAWGQQHSIELPFTDYDSFKELAFDTVKSEVRYLGNYAKVARGATAQFVYLLVGCIVAISLFLNPRLELDRDGLSPPDNLYSLYIREIAARFGTFYGSFARVMGAQIVISAINTLLTAGFVAAVRLPHALVVIGMTFLCGLLPVVGNLISNTVIVAIGFTVSPRMALVCLVFLVVIHKAEYFLNSKIVGHRIHNPLWLTLLALVLGERLMGVPGMILAPVVLNYIRVEASRYSIRPTSEG